MRMLCIIFHHAKKRARRTANSTQQAHVLSLISFVKFSSLSLSLFLGRAQSLLANDDADCRLPAQLQPLRSVLIVPDAAAAYYIAARRCRHCLHCRIIAHFAENILRSCVIINHQKGNDYMMNVTSLLCRELSLLFIALH